MRFVLRKHYAILIYAFGLRLNSVYSTFPYYAILIYAFGLRLNSVYSTFPYYAILIYAFGLRLNSVYSTSPLLCDFNLCVRAKTELGI